MKASTSGFTLIELIAVISVILILMGLLYPALSNVQASAKNTAAKDLCSQVAAAWTTLQLENGRLPSKALVQSQLDSGFQSGESSGDLYFQMGPRISSLVNWWKKTSPIAAADVNAYAPKWQFGSNKGQKITGSASALFENVEKFPADTVLERDMRQKQWGIYAPWVANKLIDPETDEPLTGWDGKYIKDSGHKSNSSDNAWGYGWVWVIIDSDGDGMVTIPAEYTDDGEALKLPATAHAWVYNEDRSKLLHSW